MIADGLEQRRERNRQWREFNRESIRERNRMRRRSEEEELALIDAMLEAERLGVPLPQPRRRAYRSSEGVHVPVGPFRAWLAALLAREEENQHLYGEASGAVNRTADRVGLSNRRLHYYLYPGWHRDRRRTYGGVLFVQRWYWGPTTVGDATVDRCLTAEAGGTMLWQLYPELYPGLVEESAA